MCFIGKSIALFFWKKLRHKRQLVFKTHLIHRNTKKILSELRQAFQFSIFSWAMEVKARQPLAQLKEASSHESIMKVGRVSGDYFVWLLYGLEYLIHVVLWHILVFCMPTVIALFNFFGTIHIFHWGNVGVGGLPYTGAHTLFPGLLFRERYTSRLCSSIHLYQCLNYRNSSQILTNLSISALFLFFSLCLDRYFNG